MSKSKMQKPRPYGKGDLVENVFTGEVFTVKACYWQHYEGGGDYTVEFEATDTQPTPWDRSSCLRPIAEEGTGS